MFLSIIYRRCIWAEETIMKYDKSVFRALSLITQFSINMLVPILMCTFLGMFIDKKAGTSFWVVILFFVGAMAGFRNIYIFAKKIFDDKSGDGRRGRRNR